MAPCWEPGDTWRLLFPKASLLRKPSDASDPFPKCDHVVLLNQSEVNHVAFGICQEVKVNPASNSRPVAHLDKTRDKVAVCVELGWKPVVTLFKIYRLAAMHGGHQALPAALLGPCLKLGGHLSYVYIAVTRMQRCPTGKLSNSQNMGVVWLLLPQADGLFVMRSNLLVKWSLVRPALL